MNDFHRTVFRQGDDEWTAHQAEFAARVCRERAACIDKIVAPGHPDVSMFKAMAAHFDALASRTSGATPK